MSFENPFVLKIPPRIQFPLNYKGSWDASANSPTLASSVGTKGDIYIVSVAGSTNLNGITDWQVSDWAVFNGSVWQKVDNTNNDALLIANNLSDLSNAATARVNIGIAVGNGRVAVAAADGTLNGFAGLTYDAGNQRLLANNLRASLLTTAGVVHNDASGNLISSLIVNADVDAAAAIARSKLAPLTINRAMITDGSGNDSVSTVTATELGYVSGVTSAIQTQLNQKQTGLNLLAVGATPNADGMSLIGPNFNLEAATASFPGVVTTGTQSFAGDKTFTGTIVASNLSGTNHGDFTISAIDSSAPNGTGFNLTPGNSSTPANIQLEAANGSFGGVLTAGTQTIGGAKTFTGAISASNLSGTNTGNITISAVGSSPNATGLTLTGQQLNLELADATNPGGVSTASQTFAGAKTFTGNVILNNNNQIGVGTATPNASALIDMVSTGRGLGLSVMTSTQKNAIASPRIGLMIYESSSVTAWLNVSILGWQPFILGSVATNQLMIGNGPGFATGSSALTVSSGTVLNTVAGAAFRGTGSNSYIGIGANSSGTNGSIFGEANTATTFFSNTAAGDQVFRNSDTTKVIRIGVGSGASQLSIGNTLISTSVPVSIGTASPNASAILQIDSTTLGFAPPRMTTLQRIAISTPLESLHVWDTDLHLPYWWNGTAWKTVALI